MKSRLAEREAQMYNVMHTSSGRHESGEENVRLDFSRTPCENVKEILSNVVCQNGVSKNKKLGYLNCFVKLLNKVGSEQNLGYSIEEILCCLKVGLLHDAKEVRAATLRVIRYLLTDKKVLDVIVSLRIDYLIARCLDICLSNEVERIHAMKLIRKIIQHYPHHVPLSLLYPMVAIGRDGSTERDRLRRACLATICELAFVNAEAADRCDAISCILRNVLDCYHYPRINESLVVTILYLLNHPSTRHYIKHNTDLEQLIAPFTDCHFKYSADSSEHGTGDDRETRFTASKMALLTVMRSWPGLIRMCRPTGSGLQSLIGILYIQNNEIRQAIMDVMFDLFRLTLPKWTDNFQEALTSVDPSAMKEEWKLGDGFVAEEGRAILSHLAKVRPNLVENHLALILAAWIETGILQALVEVITSTDGHLFVRAVILLGELLHMANTLLPHECTSHSHCLPTLMAIASSFDISGQHRHRATLAVSHLNRIHALKKRGPIPCSLFLDQLVQNANTTLQQDAFYTHLGKDRLPPDAVKTVSSIDDFVSQVIRDAHVLGTKDYTAWDWDLISAVLKCPDDKFKKMDDQNSQRFVRRLLYFYKASNNQFSSIDLTHSHARKMAIAGCHLVDFFIECDVEENNKLISEFLGDFNNCLSEIKSQRVTADALLSPNNINNTLSQFYFLFIGRFSATDRGEQCLQRAGVFQSFCDLIPVTSHDIYIKLIVSSLYYARDSSTRVILSKALVAASESGRLYATKFLRVLLRTRIPMFRSWGMEVLVTQLYDQSRAVAMAALNVVDEACEAQTNLEALIKHRPSVLHLGEKGTMLICRFLSHQRGFASLRDTNYISNELAKWHKTFNIRYVKIVEELLNEALTTYERTYEGSFTRRTSKKRPKKDVYLPIHLYGQLTQHKEGFQLLKSQECILEYFRCIKCQVLHTDLDLLHLKAALWAVGHIGTSTYGVLWLKEESLVTEIIRLAEECGVFSVRGTAFYTLGLLASTRQGADLLAQYGWESIWRNRAEKWPIVEHHEPTVDDGVMSPDTPSDRNLSISSGTRSDSEESSMNAHLGNHCNFEQYSSEEREDNKSNRAYPKHLNIPGSTKDDSDITLHRLTNISRSSTLPPRSSGFDRSQATQFSTKSKSMHGFLKDRTFLSPVNSSSPASFGSGDRSPTKSLHLMISSQSERSSIEKVEEENAESLSEFQENDSNKLANNVSNLTDHNSGRMFDITSYRTRVGSLRDQQSGSDSSKTSKSRADSFNTDSTTSGVSSCDSGPTMTCDTMCRSPITGSSTTILTNDTGHSTLSDGKDYVHPSSQQRKLVNLTRVPSLRRHCGSPPYGIKPCVQGLDHLVDNPVTYTSTRDAAGLATLRLIRRQRTSSSDVDSDYGLNNLYGDDDDAFSRTCSIGSQKSAEALSYHESILRNMSSSSLQDFELQHSSPYNTMSKNLQSIHRSGTVQPEFVGLCLPVDINMVFEVIEGEDRRSNSVSSAHSVSSERNPSGKISVDYSKLRQLSLTETCDEPDQHLPQHCLMCCHMQKASTSADVAINITDLDNTDLPVTSGLAGSTHKTIESSSSSPTPTPTIEGTHSRVLQTRSSSHEASWATPSSITSNTSTDSAMKKLIEDRPVGKTEVRKEILKFVVNLSSSVGMKLSEQGLLNLKQKFPNAFQDLCFYSDVCHLLSNYLYGLSARRFIQEIFDELDISKMLDRPQLILGIKESDIKSPMEPIRQNSMDSFSDSFI